MRKQLAGRFIARHCGRLILQLRRQPRFLDTQDDQVLLPAIKAISSIDQLCRHRAMNKPLREQTISGVDPAPDCKHPLSPFHDMKDHRFDRFQIGDILPKLNLDGTYSPRGADEKSFAILLNDWYVMRSLNFRVAVRSMRTTESPTPRRISE